jgi:hypothetical protein
MFIQEDSGLPVVTTPPCIHLRHKAMYVRNGGTEPENFPSDSTAGICWCNQTQQHLGPDAQYVGRQECIPSRECYRETY